MTTAMQDYLSGLTPKQRAKLAADSRRALRVNWSSRSHALGRERVRANLTMLRNLRAV